MPQITEREITEPQRILGLPAVARARLFAQHKGPAVLVTTSDRLELFEDVAVFGITPTFDPSLSDWAERGEKVVVTVNQAVQAFPADPDNFALSFELGRSYGRDALLEKLIGFGYPRDEMPGFVVRGDTLTLFLSSDDETDVVRLEFFGDELDAIERGGRPVDRHLVTPLSHAELDRASWTTKLLQHLPGSVFLDASELFVGQFESEAEITWLWEHLQGREVVSFGRDSLALPSRELPLRSLGYYRGKLSEFANDLEGWLRDDCSVTLLLKFERTGRYLQEKVVDRFEVQWFNRIQSHPGKLGIVLAPHAIGGYSDSERKEIVVTEELLYGHQGGRKLKRLPGKRVHDAVQLSIGDYLIHPDHGVGRFLGLEPRQVVGVTRDYLILQYAAEGKLYLPVEQLPSLRRHPGTTDTPPRLSTLGTNEWARAREKARLSAQELAAELIKTYAKRQVSKGTALPSVPDWDHLIEDNCPFSLTPDQHGAVESVFADMQKTVPMDRLISGDVGFGKTEVAIRAAHRAIGNGKQVAVLVPTTILARQHLETFSERFSELPVQVSMLSRFTSDRHSAEIVRGLREGTVDVVIGTHRLLNEAVSYKDLGLLIIDEEHRFGVAQKDRLKAIKANLDVLSLSATPIPRTLYMSLVGLRDVSQILTPPEGRKPIQTVLQPYDPLVVREAVMHELERNGKVFFVHNRIGGLTERARRLQQLVPEARIAVAHGQMEPDELEAIMLDFEDGAFDVLVSTTIVEAGLDIAGANTLVIERPDRLGLAQLYQLRGRVGRRQTEAWAYFLYPGQLTEQAQRRLYAIAELNDLGSGHLLAEKDMEIRGVGNLLGPEQHGYISAVSLEVYTEMLAEEIAKLKGEQRSRERSRVAIDLNFDARLPPEYIRDDELRIEFYGRLSETVSLAEVGRVAREMHEAHGPLPNEARIFIDLVRLRILAGDKGVASIKEHMTDVQISFEKEEVDYDARGVRSLPYGVEPTRYPPGFSIKKRGLKMTDLVTAISEVLYLCG